MIISKKKIAIWEAVECGGESNGHLSGARAKLDVHRQTIAFHCANRRKIDLIKAFDSNDLNLDAQTGKRLNLKRLKFKRAQTGKQPRWPPRGFHWLQLTVALPVDQITKAAKNKLSIRPVG